MSVRFKKEWIVNGTIERILKALNNGTALKDDGSIQFTAHDHSELFDLLGDGIASTSDIGHIELASLARRAFLDRRRQGTVESESLLRELQAKPRGRNNEPLKRYTMWTKLRLQDLHHGQGSRFQIDDVSIEITNSLPKCLQVE